MDQQNTGNLLQRQNLLSRSPGIKVIHPRGLYNAIAVDVLAILTALASSYTFRQYLDNRIAAFAPLLALTLFAAISALSIFLIKSYRERLLVLAVQTVAFLTFFYDQGTSLLTAAALILFFFFLWGEIASRRELGSLIQVGFFRISKLQLKRVATGVVLVTLIFYLPAWATQSEPISPGTFRIFFDWAGGLTSSFYPGIKFTSSFEDLVTSLIHLQYKDDSQFQSLNPDVQDQLIKDRVTQFANQLKKTSGLTIDPAQAADQTLYQLLVASVHDWRNSYGIGFIIASALAFFFLIQGIGIVFQWFAIMVAFVFYQLLLAFNVIHIAGETRTRETIEFS